MAEEKVTTSDPQGQSSQTKDPQGDAGGQSTTVSTQTQTQDIDNIPEKFKGKSASEIAKAYVEAEKKLGEHSKKIGEVRGQLDQWEKLGKILEANPELYKQVESEIGKYSGQKADTTSDVDDQVSQDVRDTKLATEGQIISGFEQKYNIHLLSAEKKADLLKKVGSEIAEMLDPGGKKTVRQVLDNIPLTKLNVFLEKGYRLATINDSEEQTRARSVIEARINREASFGSMASGSLPNRNTKLTDEQRKVAAKMGISEEKYLKQLQSLENE